MTIAFFDPVTGLALSNVEFAPFDFPNAATTETVSEVKELRLRNTDSSVVDASSEPVTVSVRHDIAVQGEVVSALACNEIVNVNQPIVNSPVISAAYSSDGLPGSGVYAITISSTSPLQVQVQRGTAPLSSPIAVAADGTTVNSNVIDGVDIVFSATYATFVGSLTIDVLGASEVITFTAQDNNGSLEARPVIPGSPVPSAFQSIIADGSTPNTFADLPGIEIVFANTLTVPLNTIVDNVGAIVTRDGGQYFEFSETSTGTYQPTLLLSPPGQVLVPYEMGFNATYTNFPTGGTIPAATYQLAIIGKLGGQESAINNALLPSVTTTGTTSSIQIDLSPALAASGYDTYDIYVNQGGGFELQITDHNFITDPSVTLTSLTSGSPAPPLQGPELTVFARARKVFPARLQTIDRARGFTSALFI